MKGDRRKRIRCHLECPVKIVTSQGGMVGETKNLSGDGAFICCREPLNQSETMALSVKFPDGFFMEVSSQVIWSCTTGPDDAKRASGMGVRFLW